MSSELKPELPLTPERQERIAVLSERTGRELATKTVLFHHHLAARLGLSATDLKCLDLLAASDAPRTASNLATLTGLSPGAITGVADRLEAAGFVERVRDPADRRRWELRPTPARRDEIAALFAPLQAALADLAANYDDEQLDVIIGFLAALGGIMDEQIQRLRTPAGPAAPEVESSGFSRSHG
jgi:DNA-binding MarR family transcriptional regulator